MIRRASLVSLSTVTVWATTTSPRVQLNVRLYDVTDVGPGGTKR